MEYQATSSTALFPNHTGIGRIERSETLQMSSYPGPLNIPLTEVMASFYNGILSMNVTNPPALCSSGNCAWPVIPSTGVCGACTNITDRIEKNCTADSRTECAYSVPNGGPSIPSERWFSVAIPGDPVIYKQGTPVFDLAIVIFSSIGLMPFHSYELLAASECALWICVQSFNTSVQSGVLTESKFKSWSYLADNGTAFSHFEQSS